MRGSRHQLRHSRVADVIKCPTVETILAYPKEQRWSLWDDATCRWCTLAPCRGAEYPCCVRMSPKQMTKARALPTSGELACKRSAAGEINRDQQQQFGPLLTAACSRANGFLPDSMDPVIMDNAAAASGGGANVSDACRGRSGMAWCPEHSDPHNPAHNQSHISNGFQRALISYAYFSPMGSEQTSAARQCTSNLAFFLARAALGAGNVLHLSVIGDTKWPPPDWVNVPLPAGVRIARRPNLSVDTSTHWSVLQEAMANRTFQRFSHFVFLNCGVRGPYVHPSCTLPGPTRAPVWLRPFLTRLGHDQAVLTGPILSCQRKPHLQSHFLVAPLSTVRRFILERWRPRHNRGEGMGVAVAAAKRIADDVVDVVEVGLSQSILRAGHGIASLRFHLCDQATDCPLPLSSELGFDYNPSAQAVDPLEAIFVKQGGSLLAYYSEYIRRGILDGCKVPLHRMAETHMQACLHGDPYRAHHAHSLAQRAALWAHAKGCCGGRDESEVYGTFGTRAVR